MTRRSLIVAVSLLVTCVQPVGAAMLLKEGIRIGGEMSGYGGKDSMTAGTKQSTYGPAIGAFLNLGLGPLAVEPELLYHRLGSAYRYPGVTSTDQLDYLQGSVFGRLSLGLFTVHAGPAIGFLIGARTAFEPGDTVDIKDHVNTFDPGVAGGLGLAFGFPGIGTLSLDFRARIGLSSIVKVPAGAPDQDVKLNVISLLAGLAF